MSVANDRRSAGQDWGEIIGRKSLEAFAEGKALGRLTAAGVTALTRNATGKIESVRLMHRPLPMVLAFSAELARRLEGKLDPKPVNHQT